MSRLDCLALALVASIACSADEGPASDPGTAALIVVPDVIAIPAGGQRQLAAQANDAQGHPIPEAPIAFATGSASLLKVSERGEVTALGATGVGEVLVTSGGMQRIVPVTVVAGSPATISKESGDQQTATATTTLREPIVVAVKDAHGNPIPQAEVHFEPSSGTVEPGDGYTSRTGLAETRWTLGKTAGEQRLAVRVATTQHTVSTEFVATADAGPLAVLGKLAPEPTSGVVGDRLAPRVRATDEFGNPRSGVAVLWNVGSGGATLSETVTDTDADGIAASTWTLGTTVGEHALIARAAGLPGQEARFAVAARPGAAARVLALPTAMNTAPAVRVIDRYENAVSAVLVRFAIVEGGGVLRGVAAMTDESGIARVERWEPETLPATLEARVDGVEETVRFQAGPAAR